MRVDANTSSHSIDILIAEGGIGPRPAGPYHQRLEVVPAGKADRDWPVVFVVIIDLVTRHGAASNESDKSLGRQRTGIPVAIIARLSLLGCVNAEQAHALTTELHGIAVRH